MKRRLRVLIDGQVFALQARGGISRVFREVLMRLPHVDPGLRVTLVVPNGCEGVPEIDGIDVVVLPQLDAGLRPWCLWRHVRPGVDAWLERRFWAKQCGDVVVSSYYTTPPFSGGRVCVVYDMIYEVLGTGMVFAAPSPSEESHAAEIRDRKRRALQCADMLVSISASTLRDIAELLPGLRADCRVVHLAGDLAGSVAASQVSSGRDVPFLLYVGGHRAPYKNFAWFLDVIRQEPAVDDMDVVVVSAETPSAGDAARWEGQFDGRLHFMAGCDDSMLAALYSDCAAFVYPSRYEGFGIPVLEALAFGAPVACSNASSLPEVGGDVVQYFDPCSPDQCRLAVVAALDEGRTDAAVARRREWAGRFSWDRTASQFAVACRAAAERKGGTR